MLNFLTNKASEFAVSVGVIPISQDTICKALFDDFNLSLSFMIYMDHVEYT